MTEHGEPEGTRTTRGTFSFLWFEVAALTSGTHGDQLEKVPRKTGGIIYDPGVPTESVQRLSLSDTEVCRRN